MVHPADIPTKDKERRNRNDSVDSRKIAKNLRNGELTPLHIPQSQEDRSLVRMRITMVNKQMQEPDQRLFELLWHNNTRRVIQLPLVKQVHLLVRES